MFLKRRNVYNSTKDDKFIYQNLREYFNDIYDLYIIVSKREKWCLFDISEINHDDYSCEYLTKIYNSSDTMWENIEEKIKN